MESSWKSCWKLRLSLGVTMAVLALASANPALAVPQFCGCWCKLEFPGTACTETTVFGYVVTNCGDWLSTHWDQCREPGPFFAVAEPGSPLPAISSPELPATEPPGEPARSEESPVLCPDPGF